MFDKRNRNNNKTPSKKSDIKKKKKIKTAHNFIINKKTLNAQTIERNERATQLILYCNFINKFIKNNYL